MTSYYKDCAVCHSKKTFACGTCRDIYYCGQEHQLQDYERHKKECDLEINLFDMVNGYRIPKDKNYTYNDYYRIKGDNGDVWISQGNRLYPNRRERYPLRKMTAVERGLYVVPTKKEGHEQFENAIPIWIFHPCDESVPRIESNMYQLDMHGHQQR